MQRSRRSAEIATWASMPTGRPVPTAARGRRSRHSETGAFRVNPHGRGFRRAPCVEAQRVRLHDVPSEESDRVGLWSDSDHWASLAGMNPANSADDTGLEGLPAGVTFMNYETDLPARAAPPATRNGSTPRAAAGALAVGAFAVGALALGAVAIGRLAVGNARIRRLDVEQLNVHHLRVGELQLAEVGDQRKAKKLARLLGKRRHSGSAVHSRRSRARA
jgi:hypothetical protein